MRARHQGNRYRLCRDYGGFFTKTRGTEGGMRAEQEGKQPRQGAVCSGGGGAHHDPPGPGPSPSRAAPSIPGLRKLAAGTGSDTKTRLGWARNGYFHNSQ